MKMMNIINMKMMTKTKFEEAEVDKINEQDETTKKMNTTKTMKKMK